MNRSFKIFFTLSLMANILLAGVVIGTMGRNFMDGPMHSMPPLPESVKNWPADKRDAFKEAMDRVGKDTVPLRDELREAHKKLADIVKAETFDKTAYLKQMQRIHELHAKLADHMAQAIVDLASQWDSNDRALLADVVRGPMMPPPGNMPPPGGEGPPPAP